MVGGTRLHIHHGRKVFLTGVLRLLGWLLLFAGLATLVLTLILAAFGS